MVPLYALLLSSNASIIVPALCSDLENGFLPTAVSIRMQSRLPEEVIVVASDCKNKSIGSIISMYKKLFLPIRTRFVFYSTKKPQGSARNLGLKLASTSHILFFDSDDIMVKDYVQIVMDLFNKNGAKMVLHSFHPLKIECKSQVPDIVANTSKLKAMVKAHPKVYWISENIAHGHVSVHSSIQQRFDSGSDGEDGRFVRSVLKNECIKSLDCIETSAKLSLYVGSYYQKRLGDKRTSFMLEHLVQQFAIHCY